jgi:hypothetical protein
MPHVALLGDSIFDNSSYTRGEPDVVAHLRSILPGTWNATLCAVDGATTSSVLRQLACVPPAATHLAVSIGGNDALQNSDLLTMRVTSMAEGLLACADRVDVFERSYRAAVAAVLATGLDVTICTIYNGALEPAQERVARTALTLFNDVILRTALGYGTRIIDLRLVCTDREDYANPIEPSGRGGLKIARAVARTAGAISARR